MAFFSSLRNIKVTNIFYKISFVNIRINIMITSDYPQNDLEENGAYTEGHLKHGFCQVVQNAAISNVHHIIQMCTVCASNALQVIQTGTFCAAKAQPVM